MSKLPHFTRFRCLTRSYHDSHLPALIGTIALKIVLVGTHFLHPQTETFVSCEFQIPMMYILE